ncbi:MAG: ferrochelatase [Proteobacteria bacterium]|nr:ferrochelatase [Pseudomonadota bacterium]
MKQAILLLNLGTPASPTPAGLRRYYRRFFADPFVFDFNPVARWLLRNFIILPFRAPRVAKDYASIWMDEGSPLQVYANRMQQSVQANFDEAQETVLVRNAMAYSSPLVGEVMAELEAEGVERIVLLSMFPQYSSATTESIFHAVQQAARKWKSQPQLHFVEDLFQEPAFIKAWVSLLGQQLSTDAVDHVIFSYHGVPEKTILKADKAGVCRFGECCEQVRSANRRCYRMQCVQTTRGIAESLGWDPAFYSMAFQSRFGPLPWTQPYLDEHILALREKGVERLAVVTPSFISDCLETLFEIGKEYRHEFEQAGGREFVLVPNLNDNPAWFRAVFEIASNHLNGTD